MTGDMQFYVLVGLPAEFIVALYDAVCVCMLHVCCMRSLIMQARRLEWVIGLANPIEIQSSDLLCWDFFTGRY